MHGITSPEWSAFLGKVKAANTALGDPEIVWYRGHPDVSHYLLASLLRYTNGLEKEKRLFESFQKFSDRIFKRRTSEWETLFEMQHYGVPTRLLDWTESFGVALFFAAYYNKRHGSGTDAAIYLLSPHRLNQYSRINRIYRIPEDERDFTYKGIYWRQTPFAATAPIAIEPIFINDRMLAQRGMFTVHHDGMEPVETQFPDAVQKVAIPNNIMDAALDFLSLTNINEYSVFPDLAGIAGYLKRESDLTPRWP
jgi:FRG domain-containing protein